MSGQPIGDVAPRFRDRLGHRALSLTGELDVAVRDATDRQLRDHIDAVLCSVIIVDLSAVTFMDSAGLDPLLHIHAELVERDRVLAVQSISAAAERLFRAMGSASPYRLIEQTLRPGPPTLRAVPDVDDLGDADLERLRSHVRQVQEARRAQAVFDQATGLVMGVHDCNAEQGRLLLRVIADHRHVDVADLAAGIVAAASRSGAPDTTLDARIPASVRAALSTRDPSPGMTC
jgi:anti-anti-sigma factor